MKLLHKILRNYLTFKCIPFHKVAGCGEVICIQYNPNFGEYEVWLATTTHKWSDDPPSMYKGVLKLEVRRLDSNSYQTNLFFVEKTYYEVDCWVLNKSSYEELKYLLSYNPQY